MQPVSTSGDEGFRRAAEKLGSLHEGEHCVNEVVALGPKVIPLVRELLFKRDPSGLFHARVHAVDALVTLGAYDVLADFLRLDRAASDPVEKLGDEAVIGAAARGVAHSGQEWAFQLLLELARKFHYTGGIIAALGSFRRPESIPVLVSALAEDEARMPAEGALKAIGTPALPALIDAAILHLPSAADESESSFRHRRSALHLVCEIGLPKSLWPKVRHLMIDSDAQIALLACKLCIDCADEAERQEAGRHLQRLRNRVDWLEKTQIDRYLSECGIPNKIDGSRT